MSSITYFPITLSPGYLILGRLISYSFLGNYKKSDFISSMPILIFNLQLSILTSLFLRFTKYVLSPYSFFFRSAERMP
jgi:hypothetical protein